MVGTWERLTGPNLGERAASAREGLVAAGAKEFGPSAREQVFANIARQLEAIRIAIELRATADSVIKIALDAHVSPDGISTRATAQQDARSAGQPVTHVDRRTI